MHFHFLKLNISVISGFNMDCRQIWLKAFMDTFLWQANAKRISGEWNHSKIFYLTVLSVFFCKGEQISREALLGGIQLIVSEWSRWNVNVQHEKRREGETDEAWERICLCLSPFLLFFFHLSLSFRLLPFFCPPETATAGATYWPLLHTIQKSSILTFQQRLFMPW